MAKLQTTIGLEIHAQLKTKSKMFSRASNAEADEPNQNIDPIVMGHPGTLPVPNKQAILYTLRIGKALGSTFPDAAKFDRKNYFYPDLPKGYQISQYDQPFCKGGELEIEVDGQSKVIRFNRVHLEEDAGKNTHTARGSLVDYNRAGTPLAEMVTEPDLSSAEEAGAFLRELRTMLRYLGVSDADMEKGHMRCDANISVQDTDRKTTTAIVEIKNLNSFRSVERALKYEEARLSDLVSQEREEETVKETRGWSDKTGQTTSQRSKEEASDYRYFPDPDLPLIEINDELLSADELRLPELPQAKRARFTEQFGMSHEVVHQICSDPKLADFYEQAATELEAWIDAEGESVDKAKAHKLTANWIQAELIKHLNAAGQTIADVKFSPENYAEFIKMVYLGTVNSSAAQEILTEMYQTGADPTEVIENKDLAQVSDAGELEKMVDGVIDANEGAVADFKAGKDKALQFMIGQVMKETKGKANPQVLKEIFEKKLD